MFLGDLSSAIKLCFWADIVPDVLGHRGIGKTQLIRSIGEEWIDPYTGTKSLPTIALYCATQEVTDLIGFPTKVWESTGEPVIEGVASLEKNDRIITSWAPPNWLSKLQKYCSQFEKSDKVEVEKMRANGASEEEIWLFWNRPKCIVFLDESKRAQRDVMQAMYPLILEKTLHTNELPRGTRIITADNPSGAYDVREPDEAFMSRFCHLEAQENIGAWHEWAMKHNVPSKVIGFLTSNPSFLLSVPENQADAVIKYIPQPDPRRWDAVGRLERFGRLGFAKSGHEIPNHIFKQVIAGIIGPAAMEQYWAFSDATVSFEDILCGKIKTKTALERIKNATEREKLKQKLQIEAPQIMKERKFNKDEAENLKKFLVELDSKERATAVLQHIFIMKNEGQLESAWVEALMKGTQVMELIKHLMDQKNV